MITCRKRHLAERCRERGYSLDEVMGCVVAVDGDMWTIDESHAAYPNEPKPPTVSEVVEVSSPAAMGGPGTELKKLLKLVGITSSPTCSCNARAKQMDEMEAREPGWCERNIATIVGWLEEQAKARKLPFVRFAAEQAVKLAIRRARKAAAR
jgi:hypothetical protein